jgi:tRNA 5-methylaminomethyl-2-thiouridine biosynthesis bifunctional protein
MKKARGHRKREMLFGTFSGQATTEQSTTEQATGKSSLAPQAPRSTQAIKGVKAPWSVNPHILTRPKTATVNHVAVIGGGLAGATSAFAMAKRGWRVSLIEREAGLAQAASGNPQGMLYTKLSPEAATLNQFTLASYLHALRYYRQLLKDGWLSDQALDRQLSFCGVLQLASTDKELKLYRQLQTTFAELPELVQFVDAKQASAIAAIELHHPGYFFPQAGWVSPPLLCQALAAHPNIQKHFNCDIEALTYDHTQWQLTSNAGKTFNADAVIIANSRDAQSFSQTANLPLKTIRGQITLLPSNSQLAPLQTVLCHEGYLTPAIDQLHSLGATFDNNDCSTELRSDDHRRNLTSLQQSITQLGEGFKQLNPEQLKGRAGLRCSSPDYLPLAGPVHQQQHFLIDYAQLTKNAHSDIVNAGRYYPDLYVNVGHGSRGLTSTPLCSELIASMINREPAPLARTILQALNPARFTIRNLIRNNIATRNKPDIN